MLNIEQRDKIKNRYLKWIADYQLPHTPETMLEWLLLNHYINEIRATGKEIINGLYGKIVTEYTDTDSVKDYTDGMKYTE